jgi:ubiquinone biosynthesis protein UbiJ
MSIRRLPRPRDPLALAKLIGDIATGQVVDAMEDGKGARSAGGHKGGAARAAKLTEDQRVEIARVAAEARWKRSGR